MPPITRNKKNSDKNASKPKKPRNQSKETKPPKNSLDKFITKNKPNEKENIAKNATETEIKNKGKKKNDSQPKEVRNLRKRVKAEQSNKITTWLSPNKIENTKIDDSASSSSTLGKKRGKKLNKSEAEPSKTMDDEIPLKRRQSYNFKKFGIFIPTLEEVMKDKEKQDFLLQQLDDFDDSSLTEIKSNYTLSPEKKTDKLDCKSLTNQQLLKYFEDNIDLLTEIENGRIFSQRHEDYHNKYMKSNHLRCSKTYVMFSFDQMHFLANLIEEKFPNLSSDYHFKVLIPELCLRIFIDVYEMSQQEAIAYIEKMRIE